MSKPAGGLNLLCFGAGAIGTYIGGSLSAAGNTVVFIDRPEVGTDLRARGLGVRIGAVETRVDHPQVVSDLGQALQLARYDAAILAVKSYDTQAVMNEAAAFRERMPPVLCLQNGVENEAAIAAALGPDKVIAGTVTTAIGRISAGQVAVEKLRGVGVAVDHPAGPALAAAMNAAGLRAKTYPHSASMKWSKMLTNLLANASSAILDLSPAQIFAHPGLFRVEMSMLKEALGVMAAQSIAVTDLPGTPVRLLTWVVRNLPPPLSQPLLLRSLGQGRGGKMPSFHIDLYSGRGRSEVDFLNGAVARIGNRVGVRTPVNAWLTRTLMDITEGSLPRDTYAHQSDKFLREIHSLEQTL